MFTEPFFQKPNHFTEKIYQTLKRHPKRIVFSDGEDLRVLRVAAKMVEMEIAVPILLGNKEKIEVLAEQEGISMLFVSVIQPEISSEVDLFCKRLKKVSRYQGREIANPCEIASRPHNFAAMMVQYGHADGMVGGNQSTSAAIFRAAKTMIKPIKGVPDVFSAMILVAAPHLKNFGKDGILFLSDCGVIPKPNVQQLASIAVETGKLARHFVKRPPKIAMLSHSSHNSASTKSSRKVQAATELAKQNIKKNYLQMSIEGEVQADVALDANAAELKQYQGVSKDPADVLVFPNLDAGHISLKLLQHVGGAQNYGQFIMGLTRPVAQVPLTVTEETLLGTAAIVGIRAIEFHNLYLEKHASDK